MNERDYILATTIARLRAADEILRHVVPANAGTVMGIPAEQAQAEWRHLLGCVDAWVARLEWALEVDRRGVAADDDEPLRREWPALLHSAAPDATPDGGDDRVRDHHHQVAEDHDDHRDQDDRPGRHH